MTTTQMIINTFIFIVNCCALGFICVIVSRWIRRVEQKIDLLNKAIDVQLRRIDTMYVNQLLSLRQMFAAAEQYEQAAQMQKLIELELKLQKERDEKSVQDRNQG
jgi:hypothetical protein|nr:MAG TPA: hypothetical protein [Caudoviricetes sp.]